MKFKDSKLLKNIIEDNDYMKFPFHAMEPEITEVYLSRKEMNSVFKHIQWIYEHKYGKVILQVFNESYFMFMSGHEHMSDNDFYSALNEFCEHLKSIKMISIKQTNPDWVILEEIKHQEMSATLR